MIITNRTTHSTFTQLAIALLTVSQNAIELEPKGAVPCALQSAKAARGHACLLPLGVSRKRQTLA